MILPSKWTDHLSTDEQKKEFKEVLGHSTTILNRLYELLEDAEKAINSKETNISEYANPSWAFEQAHLNGKKAALKEIKQLIGLRPEAGKK